MSHLDTFYSEPERFAAFFLDVATTLDEMKLLHVFGVCVRHRDSITMADPHHSSLETNHPNDRWLRLDPMLTLSTTKMATIQAKVL